MRILVFDDDGIGAEGLQALVGAARGFGEVVVVARTASGAREPLPHAAPALRIQRLSENRYAIDGTPTDCVNLAINEILDAAGRTCGFRDHLGPNLATTSRTRNVSPPRWRGDLACRPSRSRWRV